MGLLKFLRRSRKQRELDDEIESYLAITIEDNIAAGMTEAEAHDAARRKFGNLTLVKENVRDMNTMTFLEDCWNDLRHGARLLKLSPGFFAVATLSLALGIGANTAIFQLVNAVRLQMLPVVRPEQLADLQIAENEHCCAGSFWTRNPNFTNPQWEQIRARQEAFSTISAFADTRFNLSDRGEARYGDGLYVSGAFFRTLGVNPALGRLINEQDDQPGCGSPSAVLSYPFWQREYGGASDVIGKKIMLDNHPVEIAGVTAAGFYGPEVGRRFDVAVPVCSDAIIQGENSRIDRRDAWWLAIIGRLKPGWTVAQAAAQARVMSKGVFESTVPVGYSKWYVEYKLTANPGGAGVSQLRSDYSDPLLLLLGIAGAVLLIACANLANLMLARASVREREMAVRIAIGAGRGRLVRQMLAESALLTLAGLIAGALIAQWLSRYLVSYISTGDNRMFLDLAVDWRILAFTSGVGILTCVLFGIAPALRAASTSPGLAMKAGGRAVTADRSRFGLRRALVVVQVALSLVLLTGALLFGRSLRNLTTVDVGLNEDGVLIVNVDASNLKNPVERRTAFYDRLLTRLRTVPGVERIADADLVPLVGGTWNPPVEMVGYPPPTSRVNVWLNSVSPGYFETLGTPFIAGRDFNERDDVSAQKVAIVSQEFKEKFLGGADPIGKQLQIPEGPGKPKVAYEIIGVVKGSKFRSLASATDPLVFIAGRQYKKPGQGLAYIIRSHESGGPLMASIKSALLEENPNLAFQFQVFKTQVDESILRERLMATLSGFFGFLAALLASVGLYGVISYMVARRRNEIGIRVALGASRSNIVQLVFREAAILLSIGMVIGVALAIGGIRFTKALLYGFEAHDPWTITAAVALLGAVSLLASWLPAFRASRLDPVQALREE